MMYYPNSLTYLLVFAEMYQSW